MELTHNKHVGAMFEKARMDKGLTIWEVSRRLERLTDRYNLDTYFDPTKREREESRARDLTFMESGERTMTVNEMTALASIYNFHLHINLVNQ